MQFEREAQLLDCLEQDKLVEQVTQLLMREDFVDLLRKPAFEADGREQIGPGKDQCSVQAALQNLRMVSDEPSFDKSVNYQELAFKKQHELETLTHQFDRASQKFLLDLERSLSNFDSGDAATPADPAERDQEAQYLKKRNMKLVMKRQVAEASQAVTSLSQESQAKAASLESTHRLKQVPGGEPVRTAGKNGPRKKRTIRRTAG